MMNELKEKELKENEMNENEMEKVAGGFLDYLKECGHERDKDNNWSAW